MSDFSDQYGPWALVAGGAQGIADVGPFYKAETGIELEHKRLAISVSGPFNLSYELAKPMLAHKRGGIILMSSGAGLQGSPYYTHYAATRAYVLVLAESLWAEFKPYNVDVLGVTAGMIPDQAV